MSVCVYSCIHESYEARLIAVEACFMKGFSGIQLIGNVGEVVKNGLERARTALEECGVSIPQRKTVISMSPGDVRKEGNQFDLSFAVCLFLLCQREEDQHLSVHDWLFVAELGLDGSLKPVKGIISYGLQAAMENLKGIVIASENFRELKALLDAGSLPKDFQIQSFDNLSQLMSWIKSGKQPLLHQVKEALVDEASVAEGILNFDDMILDEPLEKIACTVACGHHNLLLSGTPGCGKSMFIQRLPSVLPLLDEKMHKQALIHHSLVSTKISNQLLKGYPPLQMPHHQTSPQAVLGSAYQPGEISLAHGGVLFLDEFCEFRRDIIEGLREPLETGFVRVTRAQFKAVWQARVLLAVAFNNCPCGWMGSKVRKCVCPVHRIVSYRRKLSGPILDRIDIHVGMQEPAEQNMRIFSGYTGSTTAYLKEKILEAKAFSAFRNKRLSIGANSLLKASHLLEASGLCEEELYQMITKVTGQSHTYRSMIKALRVARTLADLEFKEAIAPEHLAQAWRWQPQAAAKARSDYAYGA